MTDERVDSLLRRLDGEAEPRPSFVNQTRELLEDRVRRARAQDADPIQRQWRRLRRGLAGPTMAFPVPPAAVRWLLVGLLLAAAVGAALLAIGSQPHPRPPGWEVVTERHGVGGDLNSFFRPTPGGGQAEEILTRSDFRTAMALAWSPDRRRVAYVVGLNPHNQGAYDGSEVHIAAADGSDAIAVQILQTAGLPIGETKRFDHGRFVTGTLAWSPDSSMVAAGWSTYQCTGSPGCRPTTGIDVFRADGETAASFLTPDADLPMPLWAPDSRRVGYLSGYELESNGVLSTSDGFSFRAQSIGRPEDVTSVELSRGVSVVAWTKDDRLLVVEDVPSETTGTPTALDPPGPWRLYSMTPAGDDRRPVPGTIPACGTYCWAGIRWSPDGRRIALLRPDADRVLVIRDARTGADTTIALPKPMTLWGWSPDGDRLLLGGMTADDFGEAWVVNADGTGLEWIGSADEVSWRPTH